MPWFHSLLLTLPHQTLQFTHVFPQCLSTCHECLCASPWQHHSSAHISAYPLKIIALLHPHSSCCRLIIYVAHVGYHSIYTCLECSSASFGVLCVMILLDDLFMASNPLDSFDLFCWFKQCLLCSLHLYSLPSQNMFISDFVSFFDWSMLADYFHHNFLITDTIYKFFIYLSLSFFVANSFALSLNPLIHSPPFSLCSLVNL